jgi:hypothetical protein
MLASLCLAPAVRRVSHGQTAGRRPSGQGADVRPFSRCINIGSGAQPSYARMNERAHTLTHAHNTSNYNRSSLPLDQLSGGWRLVKQWSFPNMQLGSLVKSLLCAMVLAAIDFPP